ncbi:MAG: helix-hairpin-helix domain-containing protein [Ruminococcus sp.]|nr:helix-hairpin-helix domain-containing protein [Ruminococcus sp.]
MSDKSGLKVIAAAFSALLLVSLYLVLKSPDKNSEQMIITIESSTETTETATDKAVKNDKNASDKKEPLSEESKENEETAKTEAITEEEDLWLNINTATAEELTKLNGIGEVIAERIIEYRKTNGEFRNIEEIMNVDGIGEVVFSDIEPYIYVENPVYEIEPVTEQKTEETAEPSSKATEPITTEITTTEDISEEITETISEEETVTTTEPHTETEITLENIAPIDLNEAEKEELMLLPYVEEEIAEQIIELREKIGGFSHVYELLLIEELEQKEVSEMLEFVTVGELE